MSASPPLPTAADLHAAASRLQGVAHRTPVMTSAFFDREVGATIYFKCENLQRVGAFKFRGAANAVLALGKDRAERGVLTHSSGNHGQALALAAGLRNIRATIVMPSDSSAVKVAAVRGYGADVVFCEPGTASRVAAVSRLVAGSGATIIHPYDDADVIAGQGTAALELAADAPGLDTLLAPVGGGGLLSGTALAAHAALPGALVFGAEPAAVDDAARSLHTGKLCVNDHPQTVADGLRSASLGALTFALISAHVRDILTVSEAEIIAAMQLAWERLKLVIEPSSAVAVAVLLRHRAVFAGRRVGVILSGGNVDLARLPWS